MASTQEKDVVDIEEMVKAWGWEIYEITKSKEHAKIPRKDLRMDINWKYAKFVYGEPVYTDVMRPHNPKSQVLFRTHFTNNTDQDQEYSFKTERVTKSTCAVEIMKGATNGFETSIKVQTPCQVFEANAGFSRELTVERTEGQTLEEEITWGVDSQIKVKAFHKTVAELVVTEDGYQGTFVIKSSVQGKVIVTITNMRDNNSFVTCIDGQLFEIFSREIEKGLKGFHTEKRSVCYETRGKCNFRFGIEQHVKLNQYPVNSQTIHK